MRKERLVILAIPMALILGFVSHSLIAGESQERNAGSRMNHQRYVSTADQWTTDSTGFVEVPLDEPVTLTNRGVVSVTASLDLGGGSAQFRLRDDAGDELAPGIAHLEGSGQRAVSFTWAGKVGPTAGCNSFRLEARSLTGEEVTIQAGILVFDYRLDNTRQGEVFHCL